MEPRRNALSAVSSIHGAVLSATPYTQKLTGGSGCRISERTFGFARQRRGNPHPEVDRLKGGSDERFRLEPVARTARRATAAAAVQLLAAAVDARADEHRHRKIPRDFHVVISAASETETAVVVRRRGRSGVRAAAGGRQLSRLVHDVGWNADHHSGDHNAGGGNARSTKSANRPCDGVVTEKNVHTSGKRKMQNSINPLCRTRQFTVALRAGYDTRPGNKVVSRKCTLALRSVHLVLATA